MFDFIGMIGNYDERKIDNYDKDELYVDTCMVTDGVQPYETAVSTPQYNSGELVIVEAYDTEEQAQAGHNKWVETMLNNPPQKLVDCKNAFISQIIPDKELIYERNEAKEK